MCVLRYIKTRSHLEELCVTMALTANRFVLINFILMFVPNNLLYNNMAARSEGNIDISVPQQASLSAGMLHICL